MDLSCFIFDFDGTLAHSERAYREAFGHSIRLHTGLEIDDSEFRDFVQPADSMAIDLDLKALLLKALTIKTYLEKPEDAVTLDVAFGTLTDGTSYSARTALDAAAKNIRVVIENASHRPLAR